MSVVVVMPHQPPERHPAMALEHKFLGQRWARRGFRLFKLLAFTVQLAGMLHLSHELGWLRERFSPLRLATGKAR